MCECADRAAAAVRDHAARVQGGCLRGGGAKTVRVRVRVRARHRHPAQEGTRTSGRRRHHCWGDHRRRHLRVTQGCVEREWFHRSRSGRLGPVRPPIHDRSPVLRRTR